MAEPPTGKRRQKALERRERVLEAAIAEFLANGFAATRIEDVARRAGVGKGTVYLYFRDKEDLFAGAVRNEMMPIAGKVHALLENEEAPPRDVIEHALTALLERVATSRAGDVLRLIVGESLRFPELTAFYRGEVIVPAVQRMAALLARARADGSLRVAAVADFPQLVVAPMLLAVLTKGIAPELAADPAALLRAHLDSLFTG